MTASALVIAATKKFEIRYNPNLKLQIKVGIHSGPVIAGIIYSHGKSPKFCVLGETVRLAKLMATEGQANEIHINETTAKLLTSDIFLKQERKNFVLKTDDGTLQTFWISNVNLQSKI